MGSGTTPGAAPPVHGPAQRNFAVSLVATTTLPPTHAAEQHATWQRDVRDEPRIQPFVSGLATGKATPKVSRGQDMLGILAKARDAAAKQERSPRQALDDAALQAEPLLKEG